MIGDPTSTSDGMHPELHIALGEVDGQSLLEQDPGKNVLTFDKTKV